MLAARVASADTPGSPDDALGPLVDEALAVRTPRGFSLEGGDGATYLDGFAMPLLMRDSISAIPISGPSPKLLEQAGASEGVGPRVDATVPVGADALELGTGQGTFAAYLSADHYDVGALLRLRLERQYGRRGEVLDLPPIAYTGAAVTRLYHGDNLDVDLHILEVAGGQTGWANGVKDPAHRIEDSDGDVRVNLLARYHDGPWSIKLDRSIGFGGTTATYGLVQDSRDSYVSLESRDEIRRSYESFHGLTDVESISALEIRVSRFARDITGPAESRENRPHLDELSLDDVSHVYKGSVWRPDVALSTGMKARLAKKITGYAGLRVDSFAGDWALGPRAQLAIGCWRLTCRLDAGAYRRPAESGEELEHPELHPERTTRLALTADHAHGELRFYYTDQTRLIVRDAVGNYSNGGNGTTYGAYGILRGHVGKFSTQLALRLEHAERQDGPRAQIRPYEYDQPFRLEARIARELGAWKVGARFQLREGLPSTNVIGAAYDADRDAYLPTFGPLYAERLPWQHQLDVRIDRTWTFKPGRLIVFLDVANVYNHRPALGYVYNFTYSQREPIRALPVWPMLGVRGEL